MLVSAVYNQTWRKNKTSPPSILYSTPKGGLGKNNEWRETGRNEGSTGSSCLLGLVGRGQRLVYGHACIVWVVQVFIDCLWQLLL